MTDLDALPISERASLKPEHAALVLSVCRTEIYRLVRTGQLARVPGHRSIRIARVELERFAAARDAALKAVA